MIAPLLLFCLRALLWLALFGWLAVRLGIFVWFYVVERRERNPFGRVVDGIHRVTPLVGANGRDICSGGTDSLATREACSTHAASTLLPHDKTVRNGERTPCVSADTGLRQHFTFDSRDHAQHIRRAILVKLGVLK